MPCWLPSSVSVLMPTTSPPCALTFSFRAFRSSSSSTQGLQPLNQKFTTVKALPANRLLSTGLPSKSLPSNWGKAVPCAAAPEAAASARARVAICSSMARIFSASAVRVLYSSSENWSFAFSTELRRKSP